MASKTGSKNVFHFLFSSLLISLPFSKALASIAFVGLILVALWIFLVKKKSILIRQNRLLILPVFIFLSLLTSLFNSSNLNAGLKILWSQIDFVAIPFIFLIGQSLITKRQPFYLKIFVYASSIAALITSSFSLLPEPLIVDITAAIPLLKDYVVHEKRWAFGAYSPFIDRLQFSYLIVLAFFFQLWLVCFKRKKSSDQYKSVVDFLSAVFILIILLITLLILGARGAQIGFLFGLTVWITGSYLYFLHPILIKKIGAFFSYSLLIMGWLFFTIISPYMAYKNIPAVQVRYNQMNWELQTFKDGTFKNYSYTHFTSIRRLLSWKNSWELIKKHPLLGVGIGDYKKEMAKEYERDHLGFPVNTQSQFLYYWASTGVLGLGFLGVLLAGSLIYFLKQKDYWLKVLATSFFCFYGLVFLLDAPLNFQVGGMSFLVFYGLLHSKK